MEFGKTENIDEVDWTIPVDNPLSISFLKKLEGEPKLQIYFGAPSWNHKAWLGSIYPKGTKPADFLYHYAKYFTCIELNTVHYRIPGPEQARAWCEKVPDPFQFCPKIYKGISHARHGLRDRELLSEWFKFIEALAQNGGPTFVQLPPYFDYSNKTLLFQFLREWPDTFRLSLEFRHPSWFQDGKIIAPLAEYLQSRHFGTVITDVAGRRDVVHTSLTAPFTLIRFIGNGLHPSDFSRAQEWTKRFVQWQALGLKQLFLFIHQPEDQAVPEMATRFTEVMGKMGGWEFPVQGANGPAQLKLDL